MTQTSPPRLSVIIASTLGFGDLEVCLDSVVAQCVANGAEVIVVGCHREDFPTSMRTRYSAAQFVHLNESTALPRLLSTGIQRSKGNIIAIADTSCAVGERWVVAILEAHERTGPVIGGAVEIRAAENWVDWAAYFCEYAQFMRPLKEGVVTELPGNNISFRRSMLDRGREFVESGFWKTYWCRKLQEEGVQLVAVGDIEVYQKKSYRLGSFLVRRYHHGRCFAGMRVVKSTVSSRVCYAVGTVALPFIFAARTARGVLPKKKYRKEFLLSSPISILAILAWSMGECIGYILGTGESCRHI